ncbi:rab-GTPase-TBC domain-containing protein [Fomitopsis serialis]|uniref:rab-GTPase-TBC domain-containing protein n=1 Tax=Fomitopsis serialis TaxID=139415 RepID=UPI0020086013|nr:rab-GTPase-TBC domain-containing protein [Neoantrodia serialis]KAH9923597.1 rab-GTPase-TBC domain-containing protein [Neoantrodia serialis]
MDSPSVLVVPPTPLDPSRPPVSPPVSSAATTPDLSVDDSSRERASSETTIVTIYSMYEEDEGSWSASPSVLHPGKDTAVDVAVLGVDRRSTTPRWSRPVEDSAYFEQDTFKRASIVEKARQSVVSNGSVQLAYAERPPSSQARSSKTSYTDARHLSNGSAQPSASNSRSTSSYATASDGTPRVLSYASLSVPNSRPSSSQPTSPTTRPRSSSPHLTPASTPPPQALSLAATPPRSSPPHLPSSPSSPSSAASITPAPDEDPDAFHVRSTYAQLDVCGVRGDGYEEGVERTRARVGGSRASELRAQEALADAHEKTRELTPQEVGMLASLDRYGFYVTPSHDRCILLHAAPLLKPLARLSSANTSGPASPPLLPSQLSLPLQPKEKSRVAKWSRMLEARERDPGSNIEAWGVRSSKEHKLRERTFKGIPDCWRSAAWDTLMCRFSRHGKAETRRLSGEYREALDRPSTYDVQIDLDVPRTISGHVMFRTRYGQGQRSLFHVLHSFSLHCETCGYCQGMGPIAATLLCYFEPERVYASLVRLHDAYQMHTIFSPGFPGLLEAIYVQERMMEQLLPPVYAAFKKHMISTTSYATKWYITLFANSVPFQTQLRLWDAFLLEGHDIFVVVAVAIVWIHRDHITSASASFETVLSLLSSFFVPEDENALLSWVEKVVADKKLRSSMRQWRADWQRLVESGQQNSALL